MRKTRLAGLGLVVAALAWGQYDSRAPLSKDDILMARIRAVVSESLSHLPNFICVQTIERSQRAPNTKKFQLVDNIRLEVAIVNGKELYAWPGSPKFEEQDLRDMVGGAIGTGDFAMHARSVYLSGTAQYKYLGIEELGGRRLHKFHYRVPIGQSRYYMRIEKAEGAVGYQGDLWNDAETLELVKFDMTIDEIPPHVPLKMGYKLLEYARVEIGGAGHTMPVSMEMTLEDMNGAVHRNRAVFSGCKQYTGESTLTFGDPPPEAPVVEAPVVMTLPEGLAVTMKLKEELDLSKAATGDPVVFEVSKDAVREGKVLLGKGARVELRLDHVACQDFPRAFCLVALAPGRFVWGNKQGAFRSVLTAPDLDQMMAMLTKNMGRAQRIPLEAMAQAAPDSGFLLLSGKRPKLASGFTTTWRTLEARGEDRP